MALHPFLARSSTDAFGYLPRLEKALREFPAVQIVIASTQREIVPLALLTQRSYATMNFKTPKKGYSFLSQCTNLH
jgi:hypothetical protein